MKRISIHFSTTKTGFTNAHKAAIVNIIYNSKGPVILYHAFAHRRFCIERDIPTDVVDFFDKFFPEQKKYFNDETWEPDREQMFMDIRDDYGQVYFIGEHSEGGIKEEHELAEKYIKSINYVDLSEYLPGADQVFFS